MSNKRIFTMLAVPFLLATSIAIADTKVEKKEEPKSATDFRCEKLRGHTLAELKETLQENCNLNKPFSTSLDRQLNEETYLYCCHTK